MFDRIPTATNSLGPILNLLFGFGVLVCFLFGVFALGLIAWAFLRKANVKAKLESLSNKVTTLKGVNLTDGIDEAELEIIRNLFAKQKAEEAEAAAKLRMAKAAGFEVAE